MRERTKKKSYKDDFDFNLSDEEGKKKRKEKEEGAENDAESAEAMDADAEDSGDAAPPEPKPLKPAIDGGVNQLVAYRPNLEAEGEIAIIEKILAMRIQQQQKEKTEEVIINFIYVFRIPLVKTSHGSVFFAV